MNTGELLSIMTARVATLEKMPTGIPTITQQDVLGAMGMINHPCASLLLRVKYAHQFDFMDDLEHCIMIYIEKLWRDNHWPRYRGSMLKLCEFLLWEHIWPRRCVSCGGIGEKTVETGKVYQCGSCKGTGVRKIHDKDRASVLEIPYTTFRRKWSPIYQELLASMDRIEAIGRGALRKRLEVEC